MKCKLMMVGMLAVIAASCGGDFDAGGGPGSVDVMTVTVAPEPVVVGTNSQLSVSLKLVTGEIVNDVTTHFADPLTGEEFVLEWSTSNDSVARVDQYAQLNPRTEGYVTVSARMGDMIRTRTVRVDDPSRMRPAPSIAGDDLPDSGRPATPGDPILPDEPRDEAPPLFEPPVKEDPPEVNDPPDDPPEQNDPPEEDPPPVPCQGHAASVLSFAPGAWAGFGSADFPGVVLGPPEGDENGAARFDVLSLGHYGEIVVDLGGCEVVDGPGVDFIAFENPFFISGDPTDPFAELAVVGVSEDGSHFVEFSCDESGYPYDGCAGWNPVYSNTTNGISPFDVAHAGGDAFDLGDAGVARARYIRFRDLGYGFSGGNSAGFDLDAVSVVNGEVVP